MADQTVAVIGLGYVGLTLATVMANAGLRVYGIERRPEIVDATARGIPHFSEIGLAERLRRAVDAGKLIAARVLPPDHGCTVFIITVGTPLDTAGRARTDMIEAATHEVADAMSDGALVVIRSTVKIGTTRNIVAPILAATGKSFYIAMCPERTLEGRALQELHQLPQIVGADDAPTLHRASRLFESHTTRCVQVSSLETAEVIKLADNTYRDVQFGFANEVARLCNRLGVNAYEVIEAGKLGYERTNIALPGPVGGPCLEKDPHILRQSLADMGMDLPITAAARAINEMQPGETAAFMCARLSRIEAPIAAIAGLAFKGKPETDDLRGAMSLRIIAELKARRPDMRLRVFDPVIANETLSALGFEPYGSIEAALEGAHLLVIANNHPLFERLDPAQLRKAMATNGLIYDYWNNFGYLDESERVALNYFALGDHREGRE